MSKLKAKPPQDVTPGRPKILLFGKPGAGKTWFALSLPKPYYISPEEGASLSHYMDKLKEAGGAYMGPEDGANDLDNIIEQIKALATEKHPFKTIVIDSITKVFQTEIANEAERLGDKDAFGASKKPAIAKMRRLINVISRIDLNCVFVAHEIEQWETVGGERKSVGRTADCWEKLLYELHLVLRVENIRKKYRIATVTKSRLLGFPEYDSFLLQDGDKDLGYEEFATRYGKDYIEAETTQLTLCTKKQVKEIEKLISVLKIEDKEIEKVLSRAKADTFDELTKDQADKTIKWLRNKFQIKEEEENNDITS